jgi:hypothetical protein
MTRAHTGAVLNFLPLWPPKIRQIKNPGTMSCILINITCTYVLDQIVTKRANNGSVLNFDLCDLQKYVKSKTRALCHVFLLDLQMIKIWRWSSHLFRSYSTFCVFGFGRLVAKPRSRLDRNLVWDSGTYVQSFRSIAPAVTKRALLTDDRHHVIAIQGEGADWLSMSGIKV